jgi:hypothetical protein
MSARVLATDLRLLGLGLKPLNLMYRIALADHAFDKHSGIDPSHSVMRLCHVEQDAPLRLAGLGVDRDHLAARVTLEDGEAQPLPDLEGPVRAQKYILGEVATACISRPWLG